MQSGRAGTKAGSWIRAGEPREPDPLMGWTSAEDTLNEVRLNFATLEEAIAFAEKHGLDYR